MEWMIAALVLGLAGSLHCVGMCGPLMLALPINETTRWSWFRGRLLNQVGRLFTYAVLGLIVGFAGQQLAMAGLQQWLAVLAGVIMLLMIAWPVGLNKINRGPFRLVAVLKKALGMWLQRRGSFALFVLGMLNGLLPCGLVYIALASSLALGDTLSSAAFMALFGLGTSPALLAVTGLGRIIRERIHVRAYRVVQVTLMVTAFLLILRGANLGIPYLSPRVEAKTEQPECCHRP